MQSTESAGTAPTDETNSEISSRKAIMAIALGGFGIGTTEFVAMGLLPDIAVGFGITEPIAGHTISAYALGVVVGAPILAALTGHIPRKMLLIGLMAAFTAGNVATMLATGYGTLLAARFVSGLPHGAYLGVGALVAARLAARGQRARAVAFVLMGLSVANVVGVPIASWIGQQLGWRAGFGVVVVVGIATMVALRVWVPTISMTTTSPITELGALRRTQVWMTLIVGIVGGGGMFAVYTYISTTLTDVAGLPKSLVPLALMLFGIGMVIGNIVGGRLADRSVVLTLFVTLSALAITLGVFVAASHNVYTALATLVFIGAAGSAVGPALQTRLMDVAADSQTLAAALNHAAGNIANAFGAWIGGAVIAAGFGYTAPAVVGAALAVAGIAAVTVATRLPQPSPSKRPSEVPIMRRQIDLDRLDTEEREDASAG